MANFNFNKIIIGGRLTADPELKKTQSGVAVTGFTVAVNRRGKEGENETDFITCTAWRTTAEFICKYFRKASGICIVGELRNRNWTDVEGNKHYATDVLVNEASFVDSKSDSNVTPPAAAPAAETMTDAQAEAAAPKYELLQDEDLPF